ncbi:MAG: aminopeptidase P N-terminal domain-containing protein, partial [Bacteroidota bacterium]
MLFPTETYIDRRNALQQQLSSGLLLFLGNQELGMNYAANTYRFRQDSHFLYFFGIDRSNIAATIDIDQQQITIYGDEHTVEQIVWEGVHPSLSELAAQVGVLRVLPLSALSTTLAQARN